METKLSESAFLAGAEAPEVLRGAGHRVCEELLIPKSPTPGAAPENAVNCRILVARTENKQNSQNKTKKSQTKSRPRQYWPHSSSCREALFSEAA